MFKKKELTTKQVTELYTSVFEILEGGEAEGLSPLLTQRLLRWEKELKPIAECYNKNKLELAKKYGKEESKGKYSVEKENIEPFTKDLEEVGGLKEKVSTLEEKISIKDIEHLKIRPSVFKTLEEYIKAD